MCLGQPTKAGQYYDSRNSKLSRMDISLNVQRGQSANRSPFRDSTNTGRELIIRGRSLMSELRNHRGRFTDIRLWKDVRTAVKFSHAVSFIIRDHMSNVVHMDHTAHKDHVDHTHHTASFHRMCQIRPIPKSNCNRFRKTSRCL